MSRLKQTFGNNLSVIYNRLGYSQEKIASELGVRQATVSDWSRGLHLPSSDQVEALARLLKVDFWEFFIPERVSGFVPPDISKALSKAEKDSEIWASLRFLLRGAGLLPSSRR